MVKCSALPAALAWHESFGKFLRGVTQLAKAVGSLATSVLHRKFRPTG